MNKKILPRKEYLETLPKKRMGSGMIFLNKKDEILFLKTKYKDHLTIPGGTVDKNESPRQTAERETKEEIGLKKLAQRLLTVDYISSAEKNDESLQFVFYGGILSDEEIKNIKLQVAEIDEFIFLDAKKEEKFFSKNFLNRRKFILDAIKDKKIYYLENGQSITK